MWATVLGSTRCLGLLVARADILGSAERTRQLLRDSSGRESRRGGGGDGIEERAAGRPKEVDSGGRHDLFEDPPGPGSAVRGAPAQAALAHPQRRARPSQQSGSVSRKEVSRDEALPYPLCFRRPCQPLGEARRHGLFLSFALKDFLESLESIFSKQCFVVSKGPLNRTQTGPDSCTGRPGR